MRRIFVHTALLITMSPARTKAQVTITEPAHEYIATTPTITVSGTAAGATPVTLNVGNVEYSVKVAADKWMKPDVRLVLGPNLVSATQGAAQAFLVVNRAQTLPKRPVQKVWINWQDKTPELLAMIARSTTEAKVSDKDASAFIAAVQSRVPVLFQQRFSGKADVLLISAAEKGAQEVRIRQLIPAAATEKRLLIATTRAPAW